MTSTKCLPSAVSELLNWDNKKIGDFSKSGLHSDFCRHHSQGIVITLDDNGYCNGSN